jgi:hypothetical protein
MLHDWYAASAEGLLANLWLNQPMTVALLKSSYAPDRDTHKVWADVATQELPTEGLYTAGGVLLTGKAAPYNAATDRTDLQCADVTWGPGATFDARYAVIYDNSGTKPLWSLIDFEALKSVSNGVFTIDFAAIGALAILPTAA